MLPAVASIGATPSPKRVLILDSFGRDMAPFSVGASALRVTLMRDFGEPVDLYEVSLDAGRFVEPEKEGPFVEFLKSRFEQRRLDLVVPFGAPAVQFMAKYREALFPDTPIVYSGVDPRIIATERLRTNATLATQRVNLGGMIEDILRLEPATTNIAVVLGDSPLEKFWVAECRREFQPFTNRVGFEWLNKMSLTEIKAHAANLPPRSFILFGMFTMDATGVPFDNDEGLRQLREVANAPLFGYFTSHLGKGAIGGHLYQDAEVGELSARAAIRILRGEKAENIRSQIIEQVIPAYDWRELRRWQIPEARLPAGSEIRFREPSFWQLYRGRIVTVLGLCLGEGVLIALLVVNLRRRKRTEQSLRESEEQLQLATDSAQSGMIGVSLSTGEIWATTKTRELLGLAETAGLTYQDFLRRIHPQDRDSLEKGMREAIHTREQLSLEFRCVLGENRTRWITFRGRSQVVSGGTPDRLMGVCLDVSDRKRAELETQELRGNLTHLARVNSLGTLSGSLAHELNQPLGIILSNAEAAQELLGQQPPDVAEAQAILADIIAADRRAASVIERLRTLLKRGQMSFQPVLLNDLIEEVINLVRADLLTREVVVVRQWADGLPPVLGDRVQLQQLVLNLILNAADAMSKNAPDQRRMHIHTARQPGKARISVRDEGTGLPPNPEQVFQPFYTTKPKGLGLGLSICRSIAEAHGGRLWAEPHHAGGAIFHIELPEEGATERT